MSVDNELQKFCKQISKVYRVMPYFVKLTNAKQACCQTLTATNLKHNYLSK